MKKSQTGEGGHNLITIQKVGGPSKESERGCGHFRPFCKLIQNTYTKTNVCIQKVKIWLIKLDLQMASYLQQKCRKEGFIILAKLGQE